MSPDLVLAASRVQAENPGPPIKRTFQNRSSLALGPLAKHEKVGGAGLRARQVSAQAGKPVPPEELFKTVPHGSIGPPITYEKSMAL
jgi:hypothetical protein